MNFIIISFAQMIKFYCNDHVSSHQKLVSLLLFNGPSLLSFELHILSQLIQSFHGSSAGKESACSAGDPGLIPGLRRYPEEVIGYPLQYSWASLVAQMVKNPPGFDPWVGKIPWRRAWQPTPEFLPGECPWTEEPGGLRTMGSQRVGHN